jgi:REP element-mobilizing transposase RayT
MSLQPNWMSSNPHNDIGRKRPAQGVHILLGQPTIVFLTVCTEDRKPWLATAAAHESLRAAWSSARSWLVGYYSLMPDHLHLFCAPHDLSVPLEKWVTFWKRQFRRLHADPACRWQARMFDYRLRRQESYTEKWTYVRENPVRKGLAQSAEGWLYQGMMNPLNW